MNMSFREKSIWISLAATVLIFGYYFANAFSALTSFNADNRGLIGLFIGVVVLMIIVEVVLNIILAIASRNQAAEAEDERDNLIRLKCIRISYLVLVFGVWTVAMSLLLSASPVAMANIIIFFFILAEIVGFSTQLLYYSKGI